MKQIITSDNVPVKIHRCVDTTQPFKSGNL